MQIVIEITNEDYQRIKSKEKIITLSCNIADAVKNGTPLPKGHGRLFDERDIVSGNYEVIGNRIYELEPIIEADTEREDEE